jgi:uncharacterized protein YlxP (DUF503 family)
MSPHVGVLVVDIHIPDAFTLKDKRQVVASLLERASSRFNVSVAEVDHLENRRRAVLAFACVANESRHVRQVLGRVRAMVESDPRAEIIEESVDVDVV